MVDKEKMDNIDVVRAISSNLHGSLKWLWLIVMGLAVVNAIKVYAALFDLDGVDSPIGLIGIFWTEQTLVFISFILVFIRFYFGDSRFWIFLMRKQILAEG